MATTDTHTPYSYRIEVVSYETADGTILPAFDKNNEHITYATELNRYSAEVTVTGGEAPAGSTLDGARYEDGTQKGSIKAVVTIDVFDVTFVPNGGTLLGSTDNTVLNYQIGIPVLSDYVPVRDGGYVFDGWYLADENGEITDTAAVSEEIIFSDVTLIAKWKEPLTVKGTVTVAGTYVQYDGETGMPTVQVIHDVDRAKSAVILLQRIDANGYAETVVTAVVPVTYIDDYGYGTYEFAEIEDNDHEYRIKVLSANYHTLYQNESTASDVGDYKSYDEEQYMAEFSGDTEAVVNMYLHFAPDSFDLKYEINAASIGEGYRPEAAEVLVLYDDGTHIDPRNWAVISQMVFEDEYVGNTSALENGVGEGSESVWNTEPDGTTPYHYSIKIDSLTLDGAETAYSDSLPFAVYYNGSARYDEVNGQTQILIAEIVPRMYTVTFDIGDISDVEGIEISGMDDYATMHQTFEDTYYWSYGMVVTATPAAEGYTFLGWYDADGNKVTSISADSAENITLYARWMTEIEFEVMVDAGYYSEARDSAEKEGLIALNAFIANYDAVKDSIDSFGIYVYDTAGTTVKVNAESVDKSQLEESGGYFHVTVSNIPVANFSNRVLAAPYVVIDGEIIMGETMTISVSDINKWLGAKS